MSAPELKSPFPYPGGKSRAAPLIWARLGDTPNRVIPFAGSLAELWGCPFEPRIETVNDLDPNLANFWRCIKTRPEETARWADGPVDEADLHARHRWLVTGDLPGAGARRVDVALREASYALLADPSPEGLERLRLALEAQPQADESGEAFRARMLADPEHCNPKRAGWWVWGISAWIGSGWCSVRGESWKQRPQFGGSGQEGCGIHAKKMRLGGGQGADGAGAKYGKGVHALAMRGGQLPNLGASDGGAFGQGIHGKEHRRSSQLPYLGGGNAGHPTAGSSSGYGAGIHAKDYRLSQRLPHLSAGGNGGGPAGIHSQGRRSAILATFEALAARLRGVRVACGDFERVLSDAVTWRHGVTAVILDPPYADCADMYAAGGSSAAVFARASAWAAEHGERKDMRIVLCGYEGTWEPPTGWSTVAWKAQGGYAGQRKNGAPNKNAERERLWFSPACLPVEPVQRSLFGSP